MKMPLIILIRALNVSGKNVLKMEHLRQFMAEFGAENIQTYIQSGNIVCTVDSQKTSSIPQEVEHLLQSKAGISVKVFSLTQSELEYVIYNNPFKDTSKYSSDKVYFSILSQIPDSELVLKLNDLLKASEDKLEILGLTAYLFCENGYGKTKFSNNFLESKLKVLATTRNTKTVNMLLELSKKAEL
jgi:uncharacterized protein (DUF1697 family)